MEFSKGYKEFGEIIVKKLRDENFENYVNNRDFGNSMSEKEYFELAINSNLAPELQQLKDERFEAELRVEHLQTFQPSLDASKSTSFAG